MPSAARNDAAELRQGRVSAGDIVRQMLLPEPGIVFRQGRTSQVVAGYAGQAPLRPARFC